MEDNSEGQNTSESCFFIFIFFESTAMWGKILTLDNLQRRGKWCWLIVVSYASKVGRVLIIF